MMHLSWRTEGSNCPSEVVFERQAARLPAAQLAALPPLQDGQPGVRSAAGYAYLLSEADMCAPPAAVHTFAWNLHRATLKQLEPGRHYRYRLAGGRQHWQFQAAPAPGPDAAVTFIGFGDMGDAAHVEAKSPGAASTLLRLEADASRTNDPAQLLLHVGDLSYANGAPAIWQSFVSGLQGIAPSTPYMVAVGNHEYGYDGSRGSTRTFTDPSGADRPYQPGWGNFGPDSQGECGAVTARRFHMPRHPGSDDNPPFWYAFDFGSVHFSVISTEHDATPGSRQYAWLAADLARVDRCVTPWLVLLLHRPMYVVYPHKSNREVGDHLRASLEPLLLQHRVDLTIAGHVHSYYRTCAVAGEVCVDGGGDDNGGSGRVSLQRAHTAPQQQEQQQQQRAGRHGVVHFVIGSAGRKLSDVDWGQEDWCAETVLRWGYGRFRVQGRSRLLAEYVSSESGEVLDSVEVTASDARVAMCASGPSAPAPAPAA